MNTLIVSYDDRIVRVKHVRNTEMRDTGLFAWTTDSVFPVAHFKDWDYWYLEVE